MSVRRSLVLSFAQRNSTLIIQLVASILIARLLSPHEIGIFSVGSVIVSFSHIVRDFGVSNYLIQERELTRDRIRSAQSIILLTSWTIALFVAVLSEPAAAFYGEPGVALTMQVLALSFVLLPLGAVTVALLTREMSFGRIYAINVSGALAQNLTAVSLAWLGFGFISLAWAVVVGVLVTAAGAVLFRPDSQPWLPGLREWRRVVSAGTKLSGTSMLHEVGQGGPELVMGRVLGFESVAYYSRAVGATTMLLRGLVDSLVPVAITYFARQSREDGDMNAPYLRGLGYIAVVALPMFWTLAILADPFILLLYGPQWNQSVLPMQVLCIGMSFLAIAHLPGSMLTGSGQLSLMFRLHAVCQPGKVLLVMAVAASGLVAAATAVASAEIMLSLGILICANRHLSIPHREAAKVVMKACAVGAITALIAWCTFRSITFTGSPLAHLALTGFVSACAWGAAIGLFKHPLRDEFVRLSQALRRRG